MIENYPEKNVINKNADRAIFEIHFKGKYNFGHGKLYIF